MRFVRHPLMWMIVCLGLVACSSEGAATADDARARDDGTSTVATGPLDFGAGKFRLVEDAAATPRSHHTATELPDGQVLIAGGFDGRSFLSSAAVYDPRTGSVTLVGSMFEARAYHTATRIAGPNGQVGDEDDLVLMAGGYNGEVLDSVEVFDPRTADFATLAHAALLQPLHRHGAVRVPGPYGPDGRIVQTIPMGNQVLFVGGATNVPGEERTLPTNAAFLYIYDAIDPNASACWVASPPRFARVGHTVTAFRGPRGTVGSGVLVFGGMGLDARTDAELESPDLADGLHVLGHPEIYDVFEDRWILLGDEGTPGPGAPRTAHAAIHVPSRNGVLIVGGIDRDEEGWEAVPPQLFLPEISQLGASRFETVPDLGVRRQSPTLTLLPRAPKRGFDRDEVLISGGYDLLGQSILRSVEMYVPDDAAGQIFPAPSMNDPRVYHSASFSAGPDGHVRTADDEVIVVGGSRRDHGELSPLPTTEILQPEPTTTLR